MSDTSSSSAAVFAAFADITPLLAHLPDAPCAANGDTLAAHLDRYSVKPGPLLPVLAHLQTWQRKTPVLQHPRICAFASHYAAGDTAKTAQTLQALQGEGHPLKQLAAMLNADLRVYELDLNHAPRDAAQAAREAAQAMTYGMLAIEEKGDVVVIASLSDAAENATQTLTVPANLSPDALLDILSTRVGLDFFAALGACLAARLAGQPVLVSGAFGQQLIAVLDALHPGAAAHLYACAPTDLTQTLPPVFTPVQVLQQTGFVLSFLPAPLKTVHVQGADALASHARAV